MKVCFRKDYGRGLVKEDWVEVDEIAINFSCASGLIFRVVGVWKKPRWFDSGWFYMYGRSQEETAEYLKIKKKYKLS